MAAKVWVMGAERTPEYLSLYGCKNHSFCIGTGFSLSLGKPDISFAKMKAASLLRLIFGFASSLLMPVVNGRALPDNLKTFYDQIKVSSSIRRVALLN